MFLELKRSPLGGGDDSQHPWSPIHQNLEKLWLVTVFFKKMSLFDILTGHWPTLGAVLKAKIIPRPSWIARGGEESSGPPVRQATGTTKCTIVGQALRSSTILTQINSNYKLRTFGAKICQNCNRNSARRFGPWLPPRSIWTPFGGWGV